MGLGSALRGESTGAAEALARALSRKPRGKGMASG
jgi:hypothetical protein